MLATGRFPEMREGEGLASGSGWRNGLHLGTVASAVGPAWHERPGEQTSVFLSCPPVPVACLVQNPEGGRGKQTQSPGPCCPLWAQSRAGQADNADAAFSERVIKGVVINFKDASNNAISLGAGDAYTVRFYFDNYDIELVGQKRPWEDGGFISVPIQIR